MQNNTLNNQHVRYFIALIIAFLLALPLLWIFFASEVKSLKLDNQITTQLIQIRQHNAELSEYVLRNRSNIDNNFDSISLAQKRLLANTIELSSPIIVSNQLEQLSSETNTEIIKKIDHAERFKTLHSKINNSLRYLPILEKNLRQDSHASNIKKALKSVLINSYNFRLFNDERFLSNIKDELLLLSEYENKIPPKEKYKLSSFITHSELLLTLREEENINIQQLLNAELDNKVSALVEELILIKDKETHSIRNFKMYLSLYSAALFILTIIFLVNRHQLISSVLLHKNLSEKDQLTGLNNRRSFLNILDQSLSKLENSDQYGAVMFIDLDGFKAVNDSLGHNCGDKVLQILSEKFMEYIDRQTLQGLDINAARLGGDEFVFIVDQLKRDDLSQEVDKTAQELLKICSAPLAPEFNAYPLSASIGVAIYPEDADNVTDILNAADKAMYHSKLLGKNRYTLYHTNHE